MFAQHALDAQQRAGAPDLNTIFLGNALVGGASGAVRAMAGGNPVVKALLTGAVGGLVHGGGKVLSPRAGIAAMELGAIGSSIIANAGTDGGAFDELTLPVGPARLRLRTGALPHVDFALNAYETVMLAHWLAQPGVRVDWNHSRRAGTFVLRTSRRLGAPGGRRAAAVTTGSVVVLSELASDPERSFDHERVHVQQEWLLQEALAHPLESALRARVPVLRAIPRWLELGIVPPALLRLEGRTLGPSGPLRSLQESEAEAIELITR